MVPRLQRLFCLRQNRCSRRREKHILRERTIFFIGLHWGRSWWRWRWLWWRLSSFQQPRNNNKVLSKYILATSSLIRPSNVIKCPCMSGVMKLFCVRLSCLEENVSVVPYGFLGTSSPESKWECQMANCESLKLEWPNENLKS